MYAVAAGWLLYSALAFAQWVSADDSGGRWRAAVQLILGIVLFTGFAVMVRRKDDGEGLD